MRLVCSSIIIIFRVPTFFFLLLSVFVPPPMSLKTFVVRLFSVNTQKCWYQRFSNKGEKWWTDVTILLCTCLDWMFFNCFWRSFDAFTWVVPFWMTRHIAVCFYIHVNISRFSRHLSIEKIVVFQSIHKSSSASGRLWFTVARRVGYFILVVMKRNSNAMDNNKTKEISTEFVFQIKLEWQCSRLL